MRAYRFILAGTVGLLAVLMIACNDEIPAAPARSVEDAGARAETAQRSQQQQAGAAEAAHSPVQDADRNGREPDRAPESSRETALEAFAAWRDGLSHLVFEVKMRAQSEGEPVSVHARIHRDLANAADWIDITKLEADGGSVAIQLLLTGEGSYWFEESLGWAQLDRGEGTALLDLLDVLLLDAATDVEWLARMLRCADTAVGSLSTSTRRGRSVWEFQCSVRTSTPEEIDAVEEEFVLTMIEPFQNLSLYEPFAENGSDEDFSDLETAYAHLRLIIEQETGAAVRLELRFGTTNLEQPGEYVHESVSFLSYNEPIEFPVPELARER